MYSIREESMESMDSYQSSHCGLDLSRRSYPFDAWSHLPLKKRPIKEFKELEEFKEVFITEKFINPFGKQHYNCPECGKPFPSIVRYRAHLRRHESKRSGRYSCLVCTKTFVQRSSLTTHLRIHSGEKPFFCGECFDRFGDFSTFTKHKRIHSGEKPYACPVCERSFSQSGNMHRHLKAVHRSGSTSPEQLSVDGDIAC